jgi:hypothetical protein
MRLAPLIAACCATLLLATAGPAAADSLVFSRDNNIWLANADGSGQYQVTLDGTPSNPYSSPSQADDGTIVALRTPPGGRPMIYRMSQNGGLLNAPINTPAPGTGAIDARVSPNGALVAYWFVTTVQDPTCVFCVNIANQVLISRSNQFTNPDDVGNPHTGSDPSWLSNNQLLISGGGAADQWYYAIGMPEAVEWWGDFDNCTNMLCEPDPPTGLNDGEVSRDGSEFAVVRGDSGETIALYTASGAPPAKPNFNGCGLQGPNGKFSGPTWSQDGHTLAWHENDGIWSVPNVDIGACTSGTPSLIVPGANEPDFGPAAVNPGARPPCGNPGNPTACPPPVPPCCSPADFKARLVSLLSTEARALGKLKIGGLLKKHQLKVSFTAPAPGALGLKLSVSGSAAKKKPIVIASGRASFSAAGQKKTVVLKLTSKGKKVLKHKRKLKGTLSATFTPTGGSPVTAKKSVSLKR